MGLFSRKFKDPVRGSAQVVSATSKPSRASSAPCRMNLVVTVPALPSISVEKTIRANWKKWPSSGMVLPVEAERSDLTRLRILWDEVPTGQERGAAAAAQLAAQLNSRSNLASAPTGPTSADEFPIAPTVPGAVVRTSSVTVNGREATAAEIAQFELLANMDLDGDGKIG